MTVAAKYLLDANVFITAKRDHYGLDFCPAFWDALVRGSNKKCIASIIPVRKELLAGKDELTAWVKETAPRKFFKDVKDAIVLRAVTEVNDWVMENEQYTLPARQAFLTGADPWLVAYAKANGYSVTTYEVGRPESKSTVTLPDVATHFGVDCKQPFEMLRELGVKLRLAASSLK